MRFLAIVFCTLIILGLSYFTLRNWGHSLPIAEYDAAFFHSPTPWYGAQIRSLAEGERLIQIKKDGFIYLSLHLSADEILFAQDAGIFEDSLQRKLWPQEDYKGRDPWSYPLESLKKQFGELITLEEVLRKFPQQRVIVHLLDNAKNIHKITAELIRKNQAGDRVLIHSDVAIVVKTLRDLEPRWLYGTSRPELVRLMSLDSIGLASTSEMLGDVVVTPTQLSGRDFFNESFQKEMHRRKKKVILGPFTSREEFEKARKFQVDGYIFSHVEDYAAAVRLD